MSNQCHKDKNHYIHPLNYNLSQIVHEVVHGKGFFLLKRVFDTKDVSIAHSVVENLTKYDSVNTNNTDGSHYATQNNYEGLLWNLLGKDEIFEKIVQHPVTLEISRTLLGEKCQISSFVSNTVGPGMEGQTPHLDYPYYESHFPSEEINIQRPLLLLNFLGKNLHLS